MGEPDGHDVLRHQLTEQYRRVGELGLNELSSGNLSARVPGGMLISPTGADAASIEPDGFVFVANDGTWDDRLRPSSEWRMHLGIYRAKSSTGAVVHSHSDAAVAVSSHGRPLPGFTYVVGFLGGPDVPCVPYHTFGSQQLADDAAAALVDRSGCLLANHGQITRGRTVAGAVDAAHRLEILCRQYLLARQLGEPATLTEQEWREFFERARALAYGQQP